jgi:hypothetical protein
MVAFLDVALVYTEHDDPDETSTPFSLPARFFTRSLTVLCQVTRHMLFDVGPVYCCWPNALSVPTPLPFLFSAPIFRPPVPCSSLP